MADRTYYVFDSENCKYEAMTKEEILTAIANATGRSTVDKDSAFVTKLREMNNAKNLTFWVGKSADYNKIVSNNAIEANKLYIVTDDEGNDIENQLAALKTQVEQLIELHNDTGWIEIKRKSKSGDALNIGFYRVIGKTAFVTLRYTYTLYEQTTDSEGQTNDEVILPILLDTKENENLFTFEFIAHETHSVAPRHSFRGCRYANDKITVYDVNTSNIYGVYVTFSAPYKGMNSAYTL